MKRTVVVVGVIPAASVSVLVCERSFLAISLRVITAASPTCRKISWQVDMVMKIAMKVKVLAPGAGSLAVFLVAFVSLARSSDTISFVLAMMFQKVAQVHHDVIWNFMIPN